jgi:hypothetical protein
LRNSQVSKGIYSKNSPRKTKPNSSKASLRVNNEVRLCVAKETEGNQEVNTRPDKISIEIRGRSKEGRNQKFNF